MCGSGSYCLRYPTGWTLCYRVESPRPKIDRRGVPGWLHAPDAERPLPRWIPPSEPQERLPSEQLAVCNRFLLGQFTLTARHRAHLQKDRGLPDSAIDTYSFRSIPEPAFADVIARQVAERFPEDWQRIPGLVLRAGKPRLVCGSAEGLLIPARDLDGRIDGFRLRLDSPGNGGKYRWLSGAGGPSSGSHPSWWPAPSPQTQLRICEGELKAAVLAQRLGFPCIAAPGCQDLAGPQVLAWLHRLKPDRLLLTVDPDAFWNRHVGTATDRACRILQRLPCRFEVECFPWD